jgi:Zn-finger nucleic acid-binding protein
MNCPVCTNQKLLMTDRQGIEIDYCPNCRGVWLDRGELDKLIDKSAPSRPAVSHDDTRRHGHDSDHGYRGGYRKKKREGFLSDIFDFG